MRLAKLVYIKDLGLLFYHEDSSDILNMFNRIEASLIPCNMLAAELGDSTVELQARDTNDSNVHLTHSGEVMTVIWNDQ